jgi:hypothetical protein
VSGRSFFDAGDAGDFRVAVRVFKSGAEGGGDVRKFHDLSMCG